MSRRALDSSTLPIRDWRWTWLSFAIGALAVVVLFVPIVVLYFPARALAALFEYGSNRMWALHVSLINRDIARKHGYTRGPDGEWLT